MIFICEVGNSGIYRKFLHLICVLPMKVFGNKARHGCLKFNYDTVVGPVYSSIDVTTQGKR